MPKVTVIVPAFNREKLIRRALDSVLAQTYRDYEIIVVDDGSTDGTMDVVRTFGDKVAYVRKENGGSASARNRGIREARGEYVAFLDSDDYWAPEKLVEQVRVLDTHENVGLVYGRMPIINEQGEQVGTKPAGPSGRNYRELLTIFGDVPTSTVMARRACFDKAGLFDPDLKTMQDIDMWIRIARHYDLYEIEGKPLAFYCRHGEQITGDPVKVYHGLVMLDEKILRTLDDAPRGLIKRRLARNRYSLSRIYFDRREYKEALAHLLGAFRANPFVGYFYTEADDARPVRLFKMMKTVVYFLVCIVMNIFHPSRKRVP